MTTAWHPEAKRQVFDGLEGKRLSGAHAPTLIIHSTETSGEHGGGWPNYSSPPHLTLNPWSGELRQHVPFNRAAYAVRRSATEEREHVWQVELIGRAAEVPEYPDVWYRNVAHLLAWFVQNMDVPVVWHEAFRNPRYGTHAPLRATVAAWNDFAGFIGHCGVPAPDVHWDPGKLDTRRLERFMGDHLEDTTYADVPTDHLFHGDIEWLTESGLTHPGTHFRPDDPITRGEMAALLHRYWRKYGKP